jgi:hypothetical protein
MSNGIFLSRAPRSWRKKRMPNRGHPYGNSIKKVLVELGYKIEQEIIE